MNIAVIGEISSGKDVVAERMLLYGYYRYAFADEIKELVKKYFPHLYSEEHKPRWLLQIIGTEMFRSIDPDVWINALFKNIDAKNKVLMGYGLAKEHIVITDCRFPNEFEALKERGFTFIRIKVDEDIRKRRMIDRGDEFTEDNMKHQSETFYDTFDCEYEINNNGTLEELEDQIEDVMTQIIYNRKSRE